MNRINFTEVNMLSSLVTALDEALSAMPGKMNEREEAVRLAAREMLEYQAEESLVRIPVEALSQSKAGIRVQQMEEAGYKTLEDLARADDETLLAVNGVGEKQVSSIRTAIASFRQQIRNYVRTYLPEKKNDYQDLHAVSVYLNHRYPETFYMYRTWEFTQFNKLVDNEFPFVWGSDANYLAYMDMCDELIAALNENRTSFATGNLTKNSSLCVAAEVRAKEYAVYPVYKIRPDGRPFTTVSPQGYVENEYYCIPVRNSVIPVWEARPGYWNSENFSHPTDTYSPKVIVEGLMEIREARNIMMHPEYTQVGAVWFVNGNFVIAGFTFSY